MNTLTFDGVELTRTNPAGPGPWRTLDGRPIPREGVNLSLEVEADAERQRVQRMVGDALARVTGKPVR